jgi:hypothetical protein
MRTVAHDFANELRSDTGCPAGDDPLISHLFHTIFDIAYLAIDAYRLSKVGVSNANGENGTERREDVWIAIDWVPYVEPTQGTCNSPKAEA